MAFLEVRTHGYDQAVSLTTPHSKCLDKSRLSGTSVSVTLDNTRLVPMVSTVDAQDDRKTGVRGTQEESDVARSGPHYLYLSAIRAKHLLKLGPAAWD